VLHSPKEYSSSTARPKLRPRWLRCSVPSHDNTERHTVVISFQGPNARNAASASTQSNDDVTRATPSFLQRTCVTLPVDMKLNFPEL
jgi:hypothetical protein